MIDRNSNEDSIECHCGRHLRIVFAFLPLLPAVLFGGLQLVAAPDLETWLAERTRGISRPDAFEYVTRIAPFFSTALGCASVLAFWLIISGRFELLIPLGSGPLLAIGVYLVSYGLNDPAWFSLLAIQTVFLFVGSAVTLAIVLVRRKTALSTRDSTRDRSRFDEQRAEDSPIEGDKRFVRMKIGK